MPGEPGRYLVPDGMGLGVAVPIQESAELAVEMIMQMMREKAPEGSAPVLREASVPRLVVRASTARPGKG